jgi:hypothetical protein
MAFTKALFDAGKPVAAIPVLICVMAHDPSRMTAMRIPAAGIDVPRSLRGY